MKWWGWGSPDVVFPIEEREGLRDYLREKLSVESLVPRSRWDIDRLELPNSRLRAELVSELRTLFKDNFSCEKIARASHSMGKSYRDLLTARSLKMPDAVDGVVYVTQVSDLDSVLTFSKKYSVALIPFGGGTSVVGGLDPLRGSHSAVLSVDLRGMNRLLHLDPVSRLATFECGVLGPQLEKVLNGLGFTLGHFPQSFEFSTLGGWIAARSSGQNSLLYGNLEKLVTSVTLMSPSGKIETLTAPNFSCGPDLKGVLLGSEGTLGFLMTATVKITPLPEVREYFGYAFDSFETAKDAAREVVQLGIPCAMIRVSDEGETEALLASGRRSHGTLKSLSYLLAQKYLKLKGVDLGKPVALTMIGLESSREAVKNARALLNGVFSRYRCVYLGTQPGRKWLQERFFLPYLRDELMDQGLFCETLETSTTWSNLPDLYRSVKRALEDACAKDGLKGVVYCHISHLYKDGASLYFTIISQTRSGHLLQQWRDYKETASRAVVASGGAISHHHGIGVDHKNYLPHQQTGISVLRSIKNTLDPQGLLNPSKMI